MTHRLPKIFALTLGLSCLSSAALAQGGLDLQVKNFQVASQSGRQVSLKVFGGKVGQGPGRQAIKVFYVNGNQRQQIYTGTGTFDGTATGFQNTISVTLPADGGRIEVEVGDPARDAVPADNRRQIQVGGSDLSFDPATINQNAGANPNRELVLTILNNGPDNLAAGCKLEVDITERAAPRHVTANIPAVPKRARFQKKIPFNFAASNTAGHNQYVARIDCAADPVANNNRQEARLH